MFTTMCKVGYNYARIKDSSKLKGAMVLIDMACTSGGSERRAKQELQLRIRAKRIARKNSGRLFVDGRG
jgi:hypothetical protein